MLEVVGLAVSEVHALVVAWPVLLLVVRLKSALAATPTPVGPNERKLANTAVIIRNKTKFLPNSTQFLSESPSESGNMNASFMVHSRFALLRAHFDG